MKKTVLLMLFISLMPASVLAAQENVSGSDAFSQLSPAKEARKKAATVYVIEIQGELDEDEANNTLSKLKQAHIGQIARRKVSSKEGIMNCLYFAGYDSDAAAKSELQKLRKVAPKAFMVKKDNKYIVYAGSYKREGKAAMEQDDLYDKGVKLILKKEKVSSELVRITAGNYKDRSLAEKDSMKLKKAGISSRVVVLK